MSLCGKCNLRERRRPGASCAICHNDYQKAWYKSNPRSTTKSSLARKSAIRDFIIALKDGPCFDCGVRYPYYVMDFDHVRGEKKFQISMAAQKRYSKDFILKEVAKCDLVCANCHRCRTFSRLKLTPKN